MEYKNFYHMKKTEQEKYRKTVYNEQKKLAEDLLKKAKGKNKLTEDEEDLYEHIIREFKGDAHKFADNSLWWNLYFHRINDRNN